MNTVYGTPASTRLPLVLAGLYTVVWLITAINPWYPHDWLIENILVFVGVPLLVLTYRRAPLSDAAYIGLFLFLCLHSTGAHHTYSEVPYDAWWQALTGSTFNELVGWERNNFDRVVHFSYGLLLTPAFTELLGRAVPARSRAWMVVLVASFLGMHAMLYELVEAGVAMVVAPELGNAYLGTQGDSWDAHKDMALATLGNAITLGWLWWRGRIPVAA